MAGTAAAVKSNMSLERFEVATIAAARERGSNYCALAHGRVLSRALDVETVVQIADGTDDDPEREAIGTLARKVAANPAQVTAADLAPLRDRGFSDADILDVVLAHGDPLLLQHGAVGDGRGAGRRSCSNRMRSSRRP